MALRVNHNVPALNALRNLNATDDDMKKTLERLSSGLKVNRGSDGPATLVISEQMRGQLASIDQAIRNSEASVSMVQTAEAALAEVNNLLISIRQLGIHAANQGANDSNMLAADQAEVDNALDTIDRIAKTSQFGTRILFDGSNGANGVAVGKGMEFVKALPQTKSSPTDGYLVDITNPASKAEVKGFQPISIENFENPVSGEPTDNFELMISEGGKNVTFSASNPSNKKVISNMLGSFHSRPDEAGRLQVTESLQDYVAQKFQQSADTAGVNVDIYLERLAPMGDRVLVVRHKEFGSKHSFSVSGNIPGILAHEANTIGSSKPGRDVEGTIDGQIGVGNGEELTGPANTDPYGLTVRYKSTQVIKTRIPRFVTDAENRAKPNPELANINQVFPPVPGARMFDKEEEGDYMVLSWEAPVDVSDAKDGYVHVTQNSLAFQVGPSQGHQVKISLLDAKTEQLARGIPNESNFESLRDLDVTTAQGSQDAILLVDDAITQVSTVRAELGAFQKNTLESNTKSMRVAQENLTSAESSLRDADMAEEMSRFTRNQIMMASGVAMLAQANQTPHAVLQLLNNRPQ